jgi:peptide/nickel transport system permease protein
VTAAKVVGARDPRIVIRHLVPQLLPIMIASATVRVSSNIMTETGLSFLGLGIMPPTPSLGNMISDGDNFLTSQWWQVGIPGAVVFLLILSFNLLGEGLRDQLDPQTRSRG